MSETGFSVKEQVRFRKLLEVAASTTYNGEREAAGMSSRPTEPSEPPRPKPRRPAGFPADFGAAREDATGTWWHRHTRADAAYSKDADKLAAEKERHAEAMADAVKRGLDAEERAAAERAARGRTHMRAQKTSAWRARPEFIRVLLKETAMSAKEIAAAAGVTIYDVFKEKLLLRRASPAP